MNIEPFKHVSIVLESSKFAERHDSTGKAQRRPFGTAQSVNFRHIMYIRGRYG